MKFNILLLTLITFLSHFSYAADDAAVISKIVGMAYVDGKIAQVGDPLKVGQDIRLKKIKDYLEIKYSAGHIVRLSGAVVKVRAITKEQSYLQLFKGSIYSVVKKLGKYDKFQIRTRNASFGVRGTKFFVQQEKSQSYLCVCEGKVVATKDKKEVEVKKDQDLFVSDSKPFKTQAASKQMIKMGNDTFKSMTN